MARPLWLALIFLIGICALAALKVGVARPAKQQAALADEVIEISGNAPAKTDKLDVEEIPYKKIIRSIAIAKASGSVLTIVTLRASRAGYPECESRHTRICAKFTI
jgi:hypothetical protein